MEQLLIFLTIIFGAISLGQFLQIKKMKKNWSPDADWYLNEIPRRLKENLINRLEYYLDERNIQIGDFLEYIDRDDRELEEVVESILQKTSLVKLYLPKDLEPVVISKNSLYYPYRIRASMKMRQLLSGFEGSSFDYAFNIDEKEFEKDFTAVLDTDKRFRDRNFCTNIYFLVVKNKELYYTNAYWFSAGEPYWWPMRLTSIHKISDDGLSHWLDKDDILMVPKKIN